MTQPLRWGILGCARISRRGLIPGIRESRTGRLLGLASRARARAESWAQEFEIDRVYSDYAGLLADPEIDAVYIPLPNELHRPWTLAAAEAGKHVLCEKPLALNRGEAAEMVEACRGRGVVLMEAFMWRHDPRTARMLELIGEGAVGEPRLVRAAFSFPIAAGDWRLDPARGGGALWDVGCYGVNAARLIFGGEPTGVQAAADFGPEGVDRTLAATLAWPGGRLALVDCSFYLPLRCELEVIGGSGALSLPDGFLSGARPQILLKRNERRVESLDVPACNQYAAQVDVFAAAVHSGSLSAPAEDGLANMEVLDRILHAARQHRDL